MYDWLTHRVEIEPDGEALVHAATGDDYTFSHLDTLVDDIAGRLTSLGVGADDHLGVVLEPRLEYVCLVHAAMRLGATLVPMGDGQTPRELAGQLSTADVTTVVCGRTTEESVVEAVSRARGAATETGVAGGETDEGTIETEDSGTGDSESESDGTIPVITVDEPRTDDAASVDGATIATVDPAEWSLGDTQLILFTSGTTGDPKAVQLTTGNLLASAVSSVFRLGLDPSDRWLVTLSLHHMGGIAPILRMPLYGMSVVFRESFDAGGAADDIDRYDVTAVSLVPTMLRRMLDRRGTLSESLRVVLLGGAPASAGLIGRCRDFSIPVHPTYGMTETASQIATARPEEAFEDPESVGRPLFMTDVTIVDEEGRPLPRGEAGEVVVDGPTVTPGYYGDEGATADAFGEFGLHTGDVGVVSESGTLAVLNRVDDRIITGGENVDPGEVVDVLVSHPDVREAAVVGVPDAEWGERVSALVVPERPTTPGDPGEQQSGEPAIDRAALLDFARERLAGFKLPQTVAFADSLPRTVSGTVDRSVVRERFAGGQGQEAADDPERESADGQGQEREPAAGDDSAAASDMSAAGGDGNEAVGEGTNDEDREADSDGGDGSTAGEDVGDADSPGSDDT
ncbi:AMP-binding protein [Halobellus sp. GM3]|uniref:AMP-binding protein n=1 Tax=Halobellus sp. GM3 TaxID=3458410 RepID=UPI00403E0CF0